jgi:molecular chaperone HtpG
MYRESGNISVHTENIFPIIKQWLYSDKDIFLRELVSNGNDAIQKLKRLSDLGQADLGGQPFFKVEYYCIISDLMCQVLHFGKKLTLIRVKRVYK